ncbi:MAG: galactokinase [Oscillospiraceae bacterium]|nr:galactokinase [Oscillospiraceae bacterium]
MKPAVKKIDEIYPESALEAQKMRYRAAECGFAEHFGTLGEHRFFSTPGRVEICGNHTTHSCGKAFAASVDLDTIAVAEPTDDGFITIKSDGFPEERVSIDDLDVKEEEKLTSAALIRGALKGFKRNGYKIGGFKAYTTSKVIQNCGLGSSAAFEILIGTIITHLFNNGQIRPATLAQIARFAENEYFGKPSGLIDQVSCAVGGFVAIDFKDEDMPIIEEIRCDFSQYQHALCIVNTGAKYGDFSKEYAAIQDEMKAVADYFDCTSLRQLAIEDITLNLKDLRDRFGDRAVLRSIHFFRENERVEKIVHALKNDNFDGFLSSVRESGDSSFKYLQNIYTPTDVRHQPLSIALNIAEDALHRKGACRVHGSGYFGSMQAFVPLEDLQQFKMKMEKIFGINSCHVLSVRSAGSCEVLLG